MRTEYSLTCLCNRLIDEHQDMVAAINDSSLPESFRVELADRAKRLQDRIEMLQFVLGSRASDRVRSDLANALTPDPF